MTHADDPALGLRQVLREDGSADPTLDPFLPTEQLLAMYRSMLMIRRVDERMLAKQRQGKVGFYGGITGQEATPIGVAYALEAQDWVFPALRESSIMLSRGFPLATWLAQVYGNEADILKGRQMPVHFSGRQANVVSWSSCIGPQIPQAVGAAFAARQRGEDAVAVGFMGDGATSQPDLHAALTFAARWKVPVLLICQNNHWSISVPTERQTNSQTIAVKAHGYGLPGVRVDGNDVLAVYGAVKEAADRARAGEGPTFLEHLTYRIGPHSSSDDPSRYRSAEEVDSWVKKDPLARFERYLRTATLLDDARQTELEESVEDEFNTAVAQVEDLPPPARATLFEDVYRSRPPHLTEQRDALLVGPTAPRGH